MKTTTNQALPTTITYDAEGFIQSFAATPLPEVKVRTPWTGYMRRQAARAAQIHREESAAAGR